MPTLRAWEPPRTSISHLIDTRAEGSPHGGSWCIQLTGGWGTKGAALTPVHGVRQGDVLEVSAWVRRLPSRDGGQGGANVIIATGETRTNISRYKVGASHDTTWTQVVVVDTVASAESVWVYLEAFPDHLYSPIGLVDDISVRLVQE